ncbi:MAG: Omp28-related outer membrane protein [Flavobacteriales bacterium]|nr:Omp28-related outer membrane protein [Flavobacteriales bacterium]
MKKILLSAFVLGTFLANAQTNVSTTAENRNVVLEEFTGIHCGYCPDGHLLAQQLHDNNPGDVVLINIHVGGYAAPSAGEPDFRTQWGTAIDGQAGVAGYPAGTINRHLFPGMQQGSGTAMSRGDWATAAGQVMPQSSPVNVWSEAIVDMGTNTLTVNVEVYYTGSQTITSNKLNVAVLQNNVEGPQSGASANPTSILSNGNYNHNHMLRHLMTGQWGDDLTNVSQGTYETRTYTWTLPNDINGVELDPTQLEVVAFVAEGNQEVISGDYSSMSFIFPNSYDAYLSNSTATDIMCTPTTDLTVNFKNYGNIVLTTLDIEYSVNGGAIITYPWSGNLTSGASETVVIQNISLTPSLTNTVDVSLVSPNGQTDQNLLNNDIQCTFDGMYDAPGGQVTIEVTTDNYPSETTWKLKENGVVIANGGPFSSSGSAQTPANATISSGNCYTFIMEDSYGDGLLSPGTYKVKDANGSVIVWGGTNSPNGNFTSEESTYFESNSGATPSWDCDGQGNCQDPGNGSGQYNSLNSCVSACVATSVDNQNTESISIYPNPVKNILNISGTFELVEIYDVFGKLVLSTTKNLINTEKLSDGIYIVNIRNNSSVVTKKITITK